MLKLLPFFCLLALCRCMPTIEIGGDLDAIMAYIALETAQTSETTVAPDTTEVHDTTKAPETTVAPEAAEPSPPPEIDNKLPENARKRREAVESCTTKQGEIGKCVAVHTCDAGQLADAYEASFAKTNGCPAEEICCP